MLVLVLLEYFCVDQMDQKRFQTLSKEYLFIYLLKRKKISTTVNLITKLLRLKKASIKH